MRKRRLGIFGKVFLYTLSSLIVTVGMTAMLFAQQFERVFDEGRQQVIADNVRPLVELLDGKPVHDIRGLADAFHSQNAYLSFYIVGSDGEVLYETPARPVPPLIGTDERKLDASILEPMTFPLSDGLRLHVLNRVEGDGVSSYLFSKIGMALAVLLLVSSLVSFAFAHGLKRLILEPAEDTEKTSRLVDVPTPADRDDEIGSLTNNVDKMYSSLRTEIERQMEIEESQRFFLSAASHELKTPVASATALLQGMLDGVGDYTDYPKYLRRCMDKMDAQSRVISEMLEIVRLTGGKTPLHYESVNLHSVVESVLGSHKLPIDAKRLKPAVDVPDSLLCYTDRNMLTRSLSIVIMNAVQNAPAKEKIRIWSEDGKSHAVRLCVLNTGLHIDEEILPKLFEPFFRADKARGGNQGQSGLGLTIVAKTLGLLHAAFSIENTPEGVLFWMELPKPTG